MRAASVTATDPGEFEPIRRRDDLLVPFVEACKPPPRWRLGPEMEKFGWLEDAGHPLPYAGERSVLRILESLAARHGWQIEREYDGGPIVALVRGGASITLEPGAQFELSGAQSENVHQVAAELRRHLMDLAPLADAMGIRWLGVGFHPLARREDFDWVPKQRYAVMRDYLPKRGGHALDMMLRTCTVQVNLDYSSEADAMRKMRVALALAPATTAMFANSPWKDGAPHGGLSYRGKVWLDVDPDRTGLLAPLWRPNAQFDDYVEWALDIPMFIVKRDGRGHANPGQTFREFWKSGFESSPATLGDWRTHLNTLFPEVRLKKTIEIRGADAQAMDMSCALPALWAALFYDDRALEEVEALVSGWTYADVAELRTRAWREGLRAKFLGKPLAEVVEQVVAIADAGLARRNVVDPATGKDERVHLGRLRTLVGEGRTPADLLLEGMDAVRDPARAMIERTTLRW